MLEKAVQSAIYEKALKNHYIEILYIDFENTGKCIKLHQDTKLLGGENIFLESDEQMFDDYISKKIMRYASGDAEDLNRVEQQMTMEAITQGTTEQTEHCAGRRKACQQSSERRNGYFRSFKPGIPQPFKTGCRNRRNKSLQNRWVRNEKGDASRTAGIA